MDVLELKAEIARKGVKKGYIAEELGISTTSLHNKLCGKREFKISEAIKLREILELSDEAFDRIFFTN